MDKTFYTWEELSIDIKAIIAEINFGNWFPEFVVGIKRGGLIPATVMSHYMNLPLLVSSCQLRDGKNFVELIEVNKSLKNKKLLIVDDICDEGNTFSLMCESLRENEITNFKTCAIFFNIRQKFNIDFKARKIDRDKDRSWIVFPWEV
jgi:hypoxanthine phosphoribosyltransferase